MCMSLCSRRQRQRELVCSRKCVREEERKMWKKRPERKSIILRAVVAMVIGAFAMGAGDIPGIGCSW